MNMPLWSPNVRLHNLKVRAFYSLVRVKVSMMNNGSGSDARARQGKIHVQSKLVGGGFGGKEDMSVQHHASLAAWLLKKPVKVLLSREESLMVHPKRHGMEMDFTTGCDEEGNLTAMKAVIYADTGAYASLGGPVLQRACTHAAGPYKYQTIDVEGFAVYTNNPPAGAFRGFGVCQTAFAIESNLNLLAEKVGLSPWEIRFKMPSPQEILYRMDNWSRKMQR